MKKKTPTFHVLRILYSRNEVCERQWMKVKAASMHDAAVKNVLGRGGEVEKEGMHEGVHAVTVMGEDYLVIAAATKPDVRIVHSVVVEQNAGY